VKAVIISFGSPGGLPKRHDLSFLLDQIHHLVLVEDEIYDCADTLTSYGVATRYPSDMDVAPHHADQAIEYAEKIYEWATQVIR